MFSKLKSSKEVYIFILNKNKKCLFFLKVLGLAVGLAAEADYQVAGGTIA